MKWSTQLALCTLAAITVGGFLLLKEIQAHQEAAKDRARALWIQECRNVPVRDTSADLDGLTTGVYSVSLFQFRHLLYARSNAIPSEITTFCRWQTNKHGVVGLHVNLHADGLEASFVNGRLVRTD